MITQDLIEKFFRNECDSEEKKRIASYLQEHPEELEKYVSHRDWETFEAPGDLPPGLSKNIYDKVLRGQRTGNFSRIMVKRLAVAACTLFLLVAGWKLFFHRRPGLPSLAINKDNRINEDTLRRIWNSTDDKRTIALKDGSQVELYPESGISFSEKWDASGRVIYLKGKAHFKVVGDKKRPFIVYSDEIATWVLGTSFTVTDFEKDNTIKVNLHDGKVLVKPADPLHLKLSENMSLSPGDLLVYDKKSKLVKVLTQHTGPGNMAIKNKNTAPPEWYMFQGQSLDQVFDQLSVYFGAEIDYSPSDTRNRYFSGKYVSRDSLEEILNDIALLNGLSITKQDGRYIVKKRSR